MRDPGEPHIDRERESGNGFGGFKLILNLAQGWGHHGGCECPEDKLTNECFT